MPKLRYLRDDQSLSVAQNGFANLVRDIHRNDPVAKTIGYFSGTISAAGTSAGLATQVGNEFSATAANIIVLATLSSLVAETNDVIALTYEKVGSGFKIGRVAGSTDSDLLAVTAFGVPDRTTFPSIQSFVEKTLPNQSMRDLLEATTGAWAPTGDLMGIAIKQSTEEIFAIFSATAQTGTTTVFAVIDLDDISDIHFGE